jgi:hypothetical protein
MSKEGSGSSKAGGQREKRTIADIRESKRTGEKMATMPDAEYEKSP